MMPTARPEFAEFDDLTPAWLDGLSASDVRAAYLAGACLQGAGLQPGIPVVINLHGDAPPARPERGGFEVITRGPVDRLQPIFPLPGEIARAKRLAREHGPYDADGLTPTVAMHERVWNMVQAPQRLGELDDLAEVIVPIAAAARDAMPPGDKIRIILDALAIGLDADETAAAIRRARIRDAGTKGLRLAWLAIALARPALLRRPMLSIAKGTP